MQGRSQLSTDGFPAYSGVNGAVARAFGSEVDYATEIKTFGREEGPPGRYTPAKCLGVEREVTRSTLGYSKTFRNHRHATALFIALFNFCRTHSSLKNGIVRTPAMAAGLTDHVWTIEELLRA